MHTLNSKFIGILRAGAFLFFLPLLHGETETSPLPTAVGAGNFSALKSNSPFTRTLSVSDSLVLTGVAEIDGRPIATLLDTKTSQSYVISETPNSEGWKMVDLSDGTDLESLVASISMGGEVVRVRYDRKGISRSMKTRPSASSGPKVPLKADTREKPTDEDRKRFGEMVRKRMGNMTEEQKKKVGTLFGEKMKANPDMSDRQKGELFIGVMDHVAPAK